MKARAVMVLLFLTCVAVGGEVYRLHLQIAQLVAKLEHQKKDGAALEAAGKTETDLKDRLAALAKSVNPAPAQPAKAGEAKKVDPEARKRALVAIARNWIEAPSAPIYAHLARSLGLSDIQLDRLRDLNAERHAEAFDAIQQAHGGIHDPAEAKAIVGAAVAPVENQMRQLLGDAGYAQYLQQIQLAPAESAVQQMSQTLTGSAQPLTDAQKDQLAQLLADNQSKPNGTPDPFWSSIKLVNMNPNVVVTDATLTQASTVLSPDQMQMLTQYQGIDQAKKTIFKVVQTQVAALAKTAAANSKGTAAP